MFSQSKKALRCPFCKFKQPNVQVTKKYNFFCNFQATVASPVKGKMLKGLCVCYSVIVATYFSVAISGYWAFGNLAGASVLGNFIGKTKPLLPKWFILMIHIFILLQVMAMTAVRIAVMFVCTFVNFFAILLHRLRKECTHLQLIDTTFHFSP